MNRSIKSISGLIISTSNATLEYPRLAPETPVEKLFFSEVAAPSQLVLMIFRRFSQVFFKELIFSQNTSQ